LVDEDESVAVFAVSYDPVDTLARFAATHGITYPLLADVGSSVITELGVLNVTMEQERAAYGRPMEDRHRGVPYPGSFVLDKAGTVVSKRFEQSHRTRPTAKTLLAGLAQSGRPGPEPEVSAEASSPGVRVAAWLDTDTVYANQIQDVHIRLELDDGVHLYTEPVPTGFRALRVGLGGDDRLHVEPASLPLGRPFRIQGLAETFHVLADGVDLSIPIFPLSNRDTAGDADRTVALTAEVEYQACTDSECFMPERVVLDLPFRIEPNPGYESADLSALSPLVLRRIVEGPKNEDELLGLVNAALKGVEATGDDVSEALGRLAGKGLIVQSDDGLWSMATAVD
jgi:hypothetical protein